MSTSFSKTPADLFFSRNNKTDPRLGELAKAVTEVPNTAYSKTPGPETPAHESKSYAVVGYPDDEGIRLNGGRVGAAKAPDQIRKFLYKMTPSAVSRVSSQGQLPQILDLGNLDSTVVTDLGERHAVAQKSAAQVFESGANLIALGGGHDYGYPDTAAFAQYCRDKNIRPLVINFDAHLDVRPLDKGLSSGTPFFRLLEAFPEMDFAEIGIQAHCNSATHLKWAKDKGARLLSYEEWMTSGEPLVTYVSRHLEDWLLRPRPAFLSIDIDGFSSAYAMGCSQSWATGFQPDEFMKLLQMLSARLDVRGMGIYEVSPPLDSDDRTSKLAALLAHRFIFPL